MHNDVLNDLLCSLYIGVLTPVVFIIQSGSAVIHPRNMNTKTISKTFDKIKETEEIISSNAERIVINGATMTRDIVNIGIETTQDLYDKSMYQTKQFFVIVDGTRIALFEVYQNVVNTFYSFHIPKEIYVPDQKPSWNLPELQDQLIDFAEDKLKLGGDLITNVYNISSDLCDMVDEKENEIDGYLESFTVYSTARKYTTYMDKSLLPRFTVRVYERTKRNIAWGLAAYQIVTKGIQKSEEKSHTNDDKTFQQDEYKVDVKEEIVDKLEEPKDKDTECLDKETDLIEGVKHEVIEPTERRNQSEVQKEKEVYHINENNKENNVKDTPHTNNVDVSENEEFFYFQPEENKSDAEKKT